MVETEILTATQEESMEDQNTVPVLIVVKDGLLSSSQDVHWGSSNGYWPAASSMISLPTSKSCSKDQPITRHDEFAKMPKNYSEPSLHPIRHDEDETTTLASPSTKRNGFVGEKTTTVQVMKIRDYFDYEEYEEEDQEDSRKTSTDSKYGFFDESFKALCEEHLQLQMGNRNSIYDSLEVDYPLDFDDDDDSDFEFEIDDDSSDDEEILTPLTPRPNPSKRCSAQVQVIPASGEEENPSIRQTVYLKEDCSHSIMDCQRPPLDKKNSTDLLTAPAAGDEKLSRPSSPRASSMPIIPVSTRSGVPVEESITTSHERSQSECDAGQFVLTRSQPLPKDYMIGQEESQMILHLCPEHNILSSSSRPCSCPSTLEMYDLGKLEDTKFDATSTHRIARVFSSLRNKKDSLSADNKALQMKLRKASRLRKLSRKPSQSPFADLSEIVRPFTPPEEESGAAMYPPELDVSLDAFAEWLSNPHPFEGGSQRTTRILDQDLTTSPKVSTELERSRSYFREFREEGGCTITSLKRLSTRSLIPDFIPDEATNHLRDWDLFLYIHKTVTAKDKKVQNLVGDGAKGFADVPLEYIDHKGLPAIMASKAPMAYFLTHLLQSQHHQWLMFLWEFVTLEENVGTTRLKQMAKMYELYLNPEGYLFLGWDVLASEENFTSVNPSQLLPQLKDRAWRILAREFDVWWKEEHPLMKRMFKTIGLNTTRVDTLKLREAFSYPLHTITATFNDLLSQHQGALGPDIVFEDSERGKIVRHHSAIRTLQRKFCEMVMGVDNQFFNIKIGDFKEVGVTHPNQSPNSSSSEIIV